jgi:hypothetical protein
VLAAVGGACGQGDDCASGFCATGVCCATACTGGCETCAGTTPGVCEPDPRADCTVTVPGQVATLTAALLAIGGGGTIELTADVTETVVVDGDKNVRIRGVGDPAPTLQAADPADAALTVAGTGAVELERLQLSGSAFGLRVLAPVPVVARGIVAHHNQVGVAVDHGGTWTAGPVFRLEDSDVWLNGGDGLDVRSAPVEVTRARLAANRRNLRVEGGHAFKLANSVVAQANGLQGAVITDSDDVVVESSLFFENYPLGGLWLVRTPAAQVRDSIFQGNATVGLALLGANQAQVAHAAVSRSFNPRTAKFSFSNIGTVAEPGKLELPVLDATPKPVSAPAMGELVLFPQDSWLGNGIAIRDAQYAQVDATDVFLNEGSGIFVWDSTNTLIQWSDVYLNLRNGISLKGSFGTWIYRVEADFNQRVAVQPWDGTVALLDTSMSYTMQHPTDDYGAGFWAFAGDHTIVSCTLSDEHLVGLAVEYAATLYAEDNTISGSPIGYGFQNGTRPSITWGPGNSISCTDFAPDCYATIPNMDPAPPPAVPYPPE